MPAIIRNPSGHGKVRPASPIGGRPQGSKRPPTSATSRCSGGGATGIQAIRIHAVGIQAATDKCDAQVQSGGNPGPEPKSITRSGPEPQNFTQLELESKRHISGARAQKSHRPGAREPKGLTCMRSKPKHLTRFGLESERHTLGAEPKVSHVDVWGPSPKALDAQGPNPKTSHGHGTTPKLSHARGPIQNDSRALCPSLTCLGPEPKSLTSHTSRVRRRTWEVGPFDGRSGGSLETLGMHKRADENCPCGGVLGKRAMVTHNLK